VPEPLASHVLDLLSETAAPSTVGAEPPPVTAVLAANLALVPATKSTPLLRFLI
jgi:hypothetical protein